MNYKQLSSTSFSLNGKVYSAPEPRSLTLWQSQQMGQFISRAFREVGNLGELILNLAMSAVTSGVGGDELNQLLVGIQQITGSARPGDWTKGAINGVGEVVDYLTKDNNLARVAAVLFLNTDGGEAALTDHELDERIALFLQLPIAVIGGGVMGFFGQKRSSTSSTGSPSQTSATPTAPTSTSTASSASRSSGSSTPLPTAARRRSAPSLP